MGDNPLLPWAYSKLELFKQCPRKAYHVYVLKEKEPPSAALEEGRITHSAFEARLIGNKTLPTNLSIHEHFCTTLKQKQSEGYDLQAELKLGIDEHYKPVAFFDDRVYGRGAVDVLLVNPEKTHAVDFDWKTGKRRESEDQLAGQALLIFARIPTLQKITASYIWLSENKVGKTYTFTPSQLPAIRADIERTLESIETAQARGDWPEKPSPLCKFCHIESCKFNPKWKPQYLK